MHPEAPYGLVCAKCYIVPPETPIVTEFENWSENNKKHLPTRKISNQPDDVQPVCQIVFKL